MRTPVDPETLPVDPDFAALRGPAVAAARITAPALRARFRAPPAWQAEQTTDGRLHAPEKPLGAAAVLTGLVERAGGLNVLLTVRSPQLNDHAGQISFPGGRVETGD